jgi:hypothetical protein
MSQWPVGAQHAAPSTAPHRQYQRLKPVFIRWDSQETASTPPQLEPAPAVQP